MSQSRIDVFTEMIKKNPDDPMVWYGLASEYSKLERWGEAVEALRNVIRAKPDYTAAYQMLGSALHSQTLVEDARRAWTEGVEVAEKSGAWKAKQHMEGLLAGLPPKSDAGFCS